MKVFFDFEIQKKKKEKVFIEDFAAVDNKKTFSTIVLSASISAK